MSYKPAPCPECGKILAEVLTTDPPRCPHCKASIRFNGLTGKYVKFLGPMVETTWPRDVPADVANEIVQLGAVNDWIVAAALGQPVDDFGGSFPDVRRVLDHRATLTSLISQLLEVAEADECPNCNLQYGGEVGCVECTGIHATISDARQILLGESRAAFGRTGPCPDPIIIDKDENNEPF